MDEQDKLTHYLGRLTRQPVQLHPIPSGRLTGLSALLARTHRFAEWNWLERILVLAIPKDALDDPLADTAGLKVRCRVMEEHFRQIVVLVLPGLSAFRRDRLVQNGIPFIVPGTQLFIPPFADLCEQYARHVRVEKLSAAAQAAVLHQLRHKQAKAMPLNAWAAKLGYSPMTLTKVRDELVAAGLCVPPPTPRARGLHFRYEGRDLWDKARASLRSPVLRRMWIHLHAPPPEGLPRAGMSALADLTMIADDPIPTYACHSSDVKGFLLGSHFAQCKHREEANALLECWRYAPGLFAQEGIVDRLSLDLSLADSADERVRLACSELLEQGSW